MILLTFNCFTNFIISLECMHACMACMTKPFLGLVGGPKYVIGFCTSDYCFLLQHLEFSAFSLSASKCSCMRVSLFTLIN